MRLRVSEIRRHMLGLDGEFVIAEDHGHHPVQAVLHRPMFANDLAAMFLAFFVSHGIGHAQIPYQQAHTTSGFQTAAVGSASASSAKPNIAVIIADDMD